MADGNFGFKVNGFDSYILRLGEELRGERATLGKSLLQVQKDLKIKAAYISAIENCDLDAFPNKGFVAGYVRSYARYLNLNPEEVYERFRTESGFSSIDSSRKFESTNKIKNKGLKDYSIETHLEWKPSYVGFQEYDNSILSKGYVFFLPFLLAIFIVFGISFGAWKVLIDIQKLKIVPADNLPIIMSEMNLHSSEIVNENKINSFQLATKDFDNIKFEVSENIKLASPKVSYRDGPIVDLRLEDIGVLGINSMKLDGVLPYASVSVGVMKEEVLAKNFDYGVFPEFGELGSNENKKFTDIKIGMTGPLEEGVTSNKIRQDILSGNQYTFSVNKKDNVVGNRPETTLNIFAVNPSWIRIKDEESQVVVEKILKAGEVLEIKNNWFNGDLRAGNAKDLFFSLNGVTYGPVSDKRKVIKNFKIDPQNIFNSLKINDLEDSYLNSLLNKKRSL
tara:strand:+ start:2317 stop:3666 length:1350 start_codon:yes stop_codon:yes gene_type:complete